jgi:alginate O-acetyltransferase complex protein AlgI
VLLGYGSQGQSRKWVLAFGVGGNPALPGYFKYANFFVEYINLVTGADFHWQKILLPLAIPVLPFSRLPIWWMRIKGKPVSLIKSR